MIYAAFVANTIIPSQFKNKYKANFVISEENWTKLMALEYCLNISREMLL